MTVPSVPVSPPVPSTIELFGYVINPYAIGVLVLLCIFAWAFYSAHKQKKLNWTDLIAEKRVVSTTKLLQLIGGVTATFVIVKLSLQQLLTWDLFALYLTYTASIEGFSRFIAAKYGVPGTPLVPPAPPVPPKAP